VCVSNSTCTPSSATSAVCPTSTGHALSPDFDPVEIEEEFDGCRLCWALSPAGQRVRANALLALSDEYAVVPALGSLVDGHVLVVSRQHRGSMATLDAEELERLPVQLHAVLRGLRAAGLRWTIFEHGASYSRGPASSCIAHLHLHVLPLQFDLAAEIESRLRVPALHLASFTDLANHKDVGGYIFVTNALGRNHLFMPEAYSSQYVRQVIAARLGRASSWDWRQFPCTDRSLRTVARFGQVDGA
jgi:diadenosine tetraphosphate (Ap4A) HIT family hydrolase